MSLSATATRMVMRQLQDIRTTPIEGITLRPTDDLSVIEADLQGPDDTPFSGGTFHIALVLSEAYPEQPPKGYFRTKIFHPNVSEKGEICVNTLKRDWDRNVGLRHILTIIKCLLIEPNPESALNEEAGRLLLEQYEEYAKRAKMFTAVHAMGNNNAQNNNSTTQNNNTATTGTATTTQQPSNGLREANTSSTNTANNAVTNSSSTSKTEKKVIDKKRAALKRL